MNNQKGFALIELMAVIILVGIIATFAAFFLTTGFNGYLNSKNTNEGALNAQMALDRISMELRNIRDVTGTPSSTSLSYKSDDPTETRTLKYENQMVFIRVDTTDHMLLDNISLRRVPVGDSLFLIGRVPSFVEWLRYPYSLSLIQASCLL